MKTYRNLYPQIATFSNLLLAFDKARKGKRGKAGQPALCQPQQERARQQADNNVGFRCANTHRRPAKMPQWLATATAAGAGTLTNVRRCHLETDMLC